MIHKDNLQKQFSCMGARVKIRQAESRRQWNGTLSTANPFVVDVQTDKLGEFFDLSINPKQLDSIQVLDLQKEDRHLLLQTIDGETFNAQKYLMGHDERHWFVCSVNNSVSTVDAAKQSLKPTRVIEAQKQNRVRKKNKHKRKNKGFKRQGEWFFIPAPDLEVNETLVMRNEPIQRDARSKPHMVQELYRQMGRTVMVHPVHAPTGMSTNTYNRWAKSNPNDAAGKAWGWQRRTSTRIMYARGTVKHSDHKTIQLQGWHRIHSNAETTGRETIAYLD